MAWTGHKTDSVFRRYNIVGTEGLEKAADLLTAYRDERAKAAQDIASKTEQETAGVSVH